MTYSMLHAQLLCLVVPHNNLVGVRVRVRPPLTQHKGL